MQAVAILMIASTMGGDFPTNPNSNALRLPPALRPMQQTPARNLLDEAMRSTAETAATASNAALYGAKRAGNAVSESARRAGTAARNTARRTGNAALDGARRVADELSLDAPVSRVAQAQYQQNGLPSRPVDGMMGPGSRSAGSDPTAAYGGRTEAVPSSGRNYRSADRSYSPVTASPDRSPATPTYRPVPAATPNTNTTLGLDLPPLPDSRRATTPTAETRPSERTYSPAARTPIAPLTQPTTAATSPYTPPYNPARPQPQESVKSPIPPYQPPTTRAYPPTAPLRDPAPILPTTTSATVGAVTTQAAIDTNNNINRITRANTLGSGITDTELVPNGGSYFMTLLTLFASVGLNLYLGWIAWDTYNRYQDLVADMRTTGPRRERRRERRRFTEPSSSAAAY